MRSRIVQHMHFLGCKEEDKQTDQKFKDSDDSYFPGEKYSDENKENH